jgi:hypothetical protein
MQFPDLHALTQYCDSAISHLQETHLCPSQSWNLHGYTTHRYDHLDGERANTGTAVLVKECIFFSTSVNIQSHYSLFLPIIYSLQKYLPLAVLISPAKLNNLISQLSQLFILLNDLKAHNFLWGSGLTDDRDRTISDVCAGFCVYNIYFCKRHLFLNNEGSLLYPMHWNLNIWIHVIDIKEIC